MDLKDRTTIIQQREKSIHLSFWDIGNDLAYIREKRIYKEKYDTFEKYIDDNFKFSMRHANRMIAVSSEYNKDTVSQIGLSKLYLILSVPEDYQDEIIKQVETKDIRTREDLSREVKRFKGQVGERPAHSKDQSEFEYKLVREGEGILQIKHDLIESIAKWMTATKPLSNDTIDDLRTQLKELLDRLCKFMGE